MVAVQRILKAEFYQNKNGVQEMWRKRCRLIKLAFLESEKGFIKNFFPFF